MTEKTHMLEIYDLDDNEPNPILLEGQFIVRGPESSQYYILKPCEPLQIDGHAIVTLAIRPHYDGDPIANAIDSICTVGIALPGDDISFQEGKTYGFNDFIFWKVGKITHSHH